MPKKKKTRKTDEEVLKHYESLDKLLLPADVRKPATARFIKAELSVDPLLNQRKSAVIKVPPSKVNFQSAAKRKGRKKNDKT